MSVKFSITVAAFVMHAYNIIQLKLSMSPRIALYSTSHLSQLKASFLFKIHSGQSFLISSQFYDPTHHPSQLSCRTPMI